MLGTLLVEAVKGCEWKEVKQRREENSELPSQKLDDSIIYLALTVANYKVDRTLSFKLIYAQTAGVDRLNIL